MLVVHLTTNNMSRPVLGFSPEIMDRAQILFRTTNDLRIFRRMQAILLREQEQMNSEQVSAIIGLSVGWVRSWWSKIGQLGLKAFEEMKDHRGGRHHAYLTEEEEDAFIAPFLEKAKEGGILIVPPIHRAYEKRVKRKVKPMTVYRLLHRHGWRKIAPRPKHPKANLQAQENFKKVLFPPDHDSSSFSERPQRTKTARSFSG